MSIGSAAAGDVSPVDLHRLRPGSRSASSSGPPSSFESAPSPSGDEASWVAVDVNALPAAEEAAVAATREAIDALEARQAFSLNNIALKWIRDTSEDPPGVPRVNLVDLTEKDPMAIGVIDRTRGIAYRFKPWESQPWSWREMLAAMPKHTLDRILGSDPATGVRWITCEPVDGSYDHKRWHAAHQPGGTPFAENTRVPVWDFHVYRTDGVVVRFHTSLTNNKVEVATVSGRDGAALVLPGPPAAGKGTSDGRGTYRRQTNGNYDPPPPRKGKGKGKGKDEPPGLAPVLEEAAVAEAAAAEGAAAVQAAAPVDANAPAGGKGTGRGRPPGLFGHRPQSPPKDYIPGPHTRTTFALRPPTGPGLKELLGATDSGASSSRGGGVEQKQETPTTSQRCEDSGRNWWGGESEWWDSNHGGWKSSAQTGASTSSGWDGSAGWWTSHQWWR